MLLKVLSSMGALVIVQVLIFVLVLVLNGSFSYMRRYAYNMISEKTENRKNYVETVMNQKTSLVYETAETVNAITKEILAKRGQTAQDVRKDKELNQEILEESAEHLISLIRRNMVNDAFVILDSGALYNDGDKQQRPGLYMRDTDVEENSISHNQDIYMEMGSSKVAREYGLPLDSGWSPYLDVSKRDASVDFFLQPLENYKEGLPLYIQGYWSELSALSDVQCLSIKYSVPLIAEDGTLYGVIGIGILKKTVQKEITSSDFFNDSACYILALDQDGNGDYQPMLYTGAAYRRLVNENTVLGEYKEDKHNLWDFTAGDGPECIGSIQSLNLYYSGSPYRSHRWALISVADKKEILSMYRSVLLSVVLSSIVTLIAGMIFAVVLSRRISSPVDRMAKILKENDQNKGLVAFHSSGIQEIDTLANSIVELQALSMEYAAREKDDEYTAKLLEANQALRDAYAAATRSNDAKTDFLSRMSHDIRTPMNAIIGMATIAETHLDEPEKMADCLEKIAVSGRFLLGLINEVLDMSKIESGKFVLAKEKINLIALVDDMVEVVRSSVEEKGHKLQVHVNNLEHENVIGDNLRLQQVFMNIMSNAVKYTPPGGRLDVTVSEKDMGHGKVGCYEFVFTDNGNGMSPEFLQKIFDPFERENDERVNKEQGTGLGMAITHNIVKMMDGDIQVESEIGKGTTFIVTIFLPFAEAEPADLEAVKGMRILVLGETEREGKNICRQVEQLGMNAEWMPFGKEAVKRMQKKDAFCAVLLDWNQPVRQGETLPRELREMSRYLPVILSSSCEWAEVEAVAKEAGADGFLSKPLSESRLLTAMKSLAARNHSHVLAEIRQQDLSGHRALLVEDNELNREIALEILQMSGLQVDMAENGKEAVERFAASAPGTYDVIFMDIQMPVMNGYQAARAIRRLPRPDAKSVYIVAMTANAFAEDVRTAKEAGMNEHIAKPLDVDKLFRTLEELFTP